jgi:hypothetical protein
MMSAHVRIEITPGSLGSRIFVDGHEVQGVKAVSVRAAVAEASIVTLELVAERVDVEGEVDTVIQDVTEPGAPRRLTGGPEL